MELGPAQRRVEPALFCAALSQFTSGREDASRASRSASALSQKRRRACNARIADTVLLTEGAPTLSLAFEHDAIVERKLVDAAGALRAWLQRDVAPIVASQPVAILRLADGGVRIADAEALEALAEHARTRAHSKLSNIVAIQKLITPRGGDRSVYRCEYARTTPHTSSASGEEESRVSVSNFARYPEYLSPEMHDGRGDFMPARSFNTAVNSGLEMAAMRLIGHMEERTKTICVRAVLEFVVDERDRVWFLWPLNVRVRDDGVDAQATLVTASSAASASAASSSPPHSTWMPPTLQLTSALAEEPTPLDGPLQDYRALLGVAAGPDGAASRGHVLLVDDDAAAAVHAARTLLGAGYTVTTTDDGPRGLALSRTNAFDCILINRDLPTFSGLEVTRIIRQREAAMLQRQGVDVEAMDAVAAAEARLPILAFTHRSEPEDLRLYQEAGMNGCVTKPVLDDSLLAIIAAAIPAPTRSTRGRVVPPTPGSPSGTWRPGSSSSNMFSPPSPAPLEASRSQPLPSIHTTRVSMPAISPMVLPSAEVTFQPTSSTAPRSRSPLQASIKPEYRNSPYAQPLALVTPQQTAATAARPPVATRSTTTAVARSTQPAEHAAVSRAVRARSSVRPVTGGIHGGRMGDGAGLPAESGGAQSVSAVVAKENARKAATDSSEGDAIHGVFRLDVDTELPYCAMGTDQPGTAFFHLVVVHDMFDTYERFQVFFRRMTRKMPGIRVLLFNYPGQAYTRFRKDVTLTNDYLAGCLHALLVHVGPTGNGCFSLDGGRAPFFLLGYGNGASIATAFAAQYPDVYPHMRALVLVNGYAYVDSQLAGALHDCINVFSCTPPTRQDLPIYFYSRFLFSPAYLGKVGAALALNLYSAVANPITLDGRIALCNGALSHSNMTAALAKLDLPVICVTSTKDALVRAEQSHGIAKVRGGEVRSIRRALYSRRGAAIISLLAGHEVWLESKGAMLTLLYQLCTGYHERNDVAFLPLDDADLALLLDDDDKAALEASAVRLVTDPATMSLSRPMGAAARKELSGIAATRLAPPAPMLEDRFLDHVVATMRQPAVMERYAAPPAATSSRARSHGAASTALTTTDRNTRVDVMSGEPVQPAVGTHHGEDSVATGSGAQLHPTPAKILASLLPGIGIGVTTIQAALPSHATGGSPFAVAAPRVDGKGKMRLSAHPRDKAALPPLKRLDNSEANKVTALLARRGPAGAAQASLRVGRTAVDKLAARAGTRSSEGVASSEHTPELQEYMAWRIRRNQKRLHRLEAAATSIQRAFRSYLSRTAVRRVIETRAALDIQAWWRGEIARRYVAEVRKVMDALKSVQRVYRGHRARIVVKRMRLQVQAATAMQALFRGFLARRYVQQLKRFLNAAATRIQTACRRYAAMKELVRRRIERVAAVSIQRIARGFLGRRIAARERDRFLFSKSQAQGIEFGRQLLMEHKLQATRLQSEVAILTREKVGTEETIDGVLEEIATFEQGVRALERDMLQLAHADAEIASVVDEDARTELREQKLRLDREFARLLAKISDRKERLTALEGKLQTLDRTREAKHTELKELERKLVILLDQQQSELHAIRRRQDVRGERLVEDAVSAINESMGVPASGAGRGILALEDAAHSGTMVPHNGGGGMSAAAHGRTGGSDGTLRWEDMPEVPGSGRQRGTTAVVPAGTSTVSPQQRAEAAALMASTETMMKFGFMSMSLTYFSALNMVRAMKQVGAANHMIATDPMLQMISTAGAAGMSGALPLTALPQLHSAASMPAATAVMSTMTQHRGALRPGQLPGQEAVDPELWTVGDVCAWLDALALGQYKDAFADAAIDGSFLMELSEDDLLNTLGVEHALHRKKIVSAIIKLQQRRQAAAQGLSAAAVSPMRLGGDPGRDVVLPALELGPSFTISPPRTLGGGSGPTAAPMLSIDTALVQSTYQPSSPLRAASSVPSSGYRPAAAAAAAAATGGPSIRGGPIAAATNLKEREADKAEAAALDAMRADSASIRLDELLSWVRNNKGKQLGDALALLPDTNFDRALVRDAYAPGFGTVYIDRLNTPAFHINKADEHGNTLLTVACQNGRMKMAQLLLRKGANVNHQNSGGNTAAHFAYTYKFWDLAAWLMDPSKGGADDSIANASGNTPYDGLE